MPSHSKGMKFGMYTSGTEGMCDGHTHNASQGREMQDAQDFADQGTHVATLPASSYCQLAGMLLLCQRACVCGGGVMEMEGDRGSPGETETVAEPGETETAAEPEA